LIRIHRWKRPRARCRRLRTSTTDPRRPQGDPGATNRQDSIDAAAMVPSSVSRRHGNVAAAFSQARQSAASFSASAAARGFGSAAMAQRAVGCCRGRWRRTVLHVMGMEVYFLFRCRPYVHVAHCECSTRCLRLVQLARASHTVASPISRFFLSILFRKVSLRKGNTQYSEVQSP
jgi:hypothetical protein